MSTPDVAAALHRLDADTDFLVPELRDEMRADLALVAQALADCDEGKALHEELYAAAVAENDRIRAGWNASQQALADARRQAVEACIGVLMSGKEMREDGFWVAGEAAEALRALLSPAPRREEA